MNRKVSHSAVLILQILLIASLGLAAQVPPVPKGPVPIASAQDKATVKPSVAAQSKARSKALKEQRAKAAVSVKFVDINSATKDELKAIPGVTDVYADKIIAGRPYLTKAHLVTHNILDAGLYESIKKRIVARQKLPNH